MQYLIFFEDTKGVARVKIIICVTFSRLNILDIFGCIFWKFCQCKLNEKYQVCLAVAMLMMIRKRNGLKNKD